MGSHGPPWAHGPGPGPGPRARDRRLPPPGLSPPPPLPPLRALTGRPLASTVMVSCSKRQGGVAASSRRRVMSSGLCR